MNLRDVFTAEAIAANWTETASNSIPYYGAGLFPARKKAGLDLKWIRGNKGLPVSLAPSAFDAKSTFRDRIGVSISKTQMAFFRESMLITEEDEQEDLDKIVKKVTELRIFKDDAGKTNLSLQDVNGELLIVSQFTLLADCKKGRRPSFVKAGNPQKAEEMYEEFIRVCKEKVPKVEHGVFGADMKVELLNDGPFTIVLDSKEL